jgi:hypothetical protein
VAAAVAQCGGLAAGIDEENDVFAQQPERLGAMGQFGERHDGMPELAKDGLLGNEHARTPSVVVWDERERAISCLHARGSWEPVRHRAAERFYSAQPALQIASPDCGAAPAAPSAIRNARAKRVGLALGMRRASHAARVEAFSSARTTNVRPPGNCS